MYRYPRIFIGCGTLILKWANIKVYKLFEETSKNTNILHVQF